MKPVTPTAEPLHSAPLRRSPRWLGALLPALWLFSTAPPAAAQSGVEGEFSVQRFHPAPGPHNFFTTRGARVNGKMAYSVGLLASYAYKPFTIVSCESETNCDESSPLRKDINVVESLGSADLMGTLTPVPQVQVGLRLPVAYAKGHGITSDGYPVEGGLEAFGLGDAELEGKFRLLGSPEDPVVLGAAAFIIVPFGHWTAKDSYIGDESVGFGGRGIVDFSKGPLRAAANVTGVWKKGGRVGTADLGGEMRVGLAAGYEVSPIFTPVLEVYGSSRFNFENDGTNSGEGLLGAHITPIGMPVVFMLGAGTGLIQGIGAPALRAFLGASYVVEDRDRDGDGLTDDVDQCPALAEDMDGKDDSDGCPDEDNDGDLLPDVQDKCPNEAEDPDGFDDIDGCPDFDNDKDKIPDDHDACPNKPETVNGYKDQDGCPDVPDSDDDGIEDTKDQCPFDAEDTDGFEDLDGCPELDNDQDGIPDNGDECYLEPETYNGFEDQDGCPDVIPEGEEP